MHLGYNFQHVRNWGPPPKVTERGPIEIWAVVDSEDRNIVVSEDDRTAIVSQDDRTAIVSQDNRNT